MKLITYILEHTDPKTGIFKGSYTKISEQTGVSYSAVCSFIQTCQKDGTLTHKGISTWKVDRSLLPSDKEADLDDSFFLGIKNYVTP